MDGKPTIIIIIINIYQWMIIVEAEPKLKITYIRELRAPIRSTLLCLRAQENLNLPLICVYMENLCIVTQSTLDIYIPNIHIESVRKLF